MVSAQRILRGVLIGSGYSAGFQLEAWARIEGVEITAIASLSEEEAERRASEFNIPAVYTDYSIMIDREKPDFVDVATPPKTHVEMVRAAARHRCPVLCQKPISSTLAELRHMVEECQKAGVLFMVNENGRFQPWFRKMKELINQGVIGQPFYTNLTARARVTYPPSKDNPQWHMFATMPRLVVFELGVHFLDTLRYLFGEASTIQARMNRISPDVEGEDQAVLMVGMGGVTAVIDLGWASLPTWQESERISWGEYRIEGTSGTLHLHPNGVLRVLTKSGEDCELFPQDAVLLGYQSAQQHFVDCLIEGKEPETSGAQSLKTMELVFGAYDAAECTRTYVVGRDLPRLG